MLTAIIIDDETSSRNSLKQKLAHHCTEIEIIGECENGEAGIKMLSNKNPDIVFLDVEMPRMNGFTMLQQLPHKNFEVIFITAYDHYAIKAIKFSALDYLVKPVAIEDLKAAIEKAAQKRKQSQGNDRLQLLLENLMTDKKELQRIAIPSMEGLQFVETGHIIYLEANSNYTCFYLTNNTKITVAKTLKDFEELLPTSVFMRIHHSYIINKNLVKKYIKGEGGQVQMINDTVLDVARRKKEEFMKAMGH
ncbi:MAG TPA: LytTR family DNA-binding domain-containing protein [Ferruginibacter sp.]|nr:LytTR family DNA-binding domain-containing protein [Ferruginibacter sp.]